MLGVDDDDPKIDSYRRIAKNLNFVTLIVFESKLFKEEGLSGLWNIMADRCAGDIISMVGDDMIFKTNDWDKKIIDTFQQQKDNIHLINTFRELFPQTKVIFNYSTDIERQSHSAWFNKWDSKEELLERNSILKEHYEENKDFIYLNTMQKTISGDLYDLFKFIDCEKYYNTDKIRYILNDNYNDPNHKYYHLNNIYT